MSESKYYLGAFRKARRYRILSLDGGGIYGLTEALLLKELCDRDKDFLTTKQPIAVFAGCSAGAVNALLLAKYKNPREAIERGELEEFWGGAQGLGNFDPLSWWWSCLGITPTPNDFRHRLERHFGDMTLGQLEQNVLISTFAWSGKDSLPGIKNPWTRGEKPPDPSPLDSILELWFPWLRGWLPPSPPPRPTEGLWERYDRPSYPWVAYDDPDPMTLKAVRGNLPEGVRTDSYRHWQPRFFQVFNNQPLGGKAKFINKRSRIPPNQRIVPANPKEGEAVDFEMKRNPHRGARVVDVAYAAGAVPGLSEIRHGLGDGASFAANPAPQAFVRLMQYLRWSVFNADIVREMMPLVDGFRKAWPEDEWKRKHPDYPSESVPRYEPEEEPWNLTDRILAARELELRAQAAISVLSVGDGSKMPYLWPPTRNFGSLPFYLGAPNPWRGQFYPPLAYTLQPANEVADLTMRELLGWNYCRLNPAVMELPTTVACQAAENPFFKRWIVQRIHEGIRGRTTQEALDLTDRYFLKEPFFWQNNKVSLAMPLGSAGHPELLKRFKGMEKELDELLKEIRDQRMPGRGDPFTFQEEGEGGEDPKDPNYPFGREKPPEGPIGRTKVGK